MLFKICDDLNAVKDLHRKIFCNDFPEESMKEKISRGYDVKQVMFMSGNEPAGYGVLIEDKENETIRAWVGGVLPGCQGNGVIGLFFDWLTEYAGSSGFHRIDCNTDNFKPEMIITLTKRGYNIVGLSESDYGDKRKIKFSKTLTNIRNLRIGITNLCNYNCPFCHMEGVKLNEGAKISLPDLRLLLLQANKLAFREITITGGEPFLHHEAVFFILKTCSRWINPPSVKIDTNGSLLNYEILDRLIPYRKLIQLHISLHTLNASDTQKIYGHKASLEYSQKNEKLFDRLNEYRFNYRINYVLLEGINAGVHDLSKIICYCLRKNIPDINMMELLVRKNQSALLPYYVSSKTICERIESISGLSVSKTESNSKKTVYTVKSGHDEMRVSVYRLSCRNGCEKCAEGNDIMIGADSSCYPCFLEPEISISSQYSLEEMISRRENFIRQRGINFSEDILYWGNGA